MLVAVLLVSAAAERCPSAGRRTVLTEACIRYSRLDLYLAEEDSAVLENRKTMVKPIPCEAGRKIAILRSLRISNFTDFRLLSACKPELFEDLYL